MATYLYRCTVCDKRFEHTAAEDLLCDYACFAPLRRDYQAEATNVNTVNLREARS